MIAVFSKCRKVPTINPDQLFNSLAQEEKDFLNRVGNRFTISPNLDIFGEPDDPIVVRHMTDLKNYIVGIPNFYTTDVFEKVRIARERELWEIEERKRRIKERNDHQGRQGAGQENEFIHERSNAGLYMIIEILTNIIATSTTNTIDKEECFAADSKVILQNGKVTKISELVIGDYVCCGFENGKQVFSEVFLIIHADPNAMTEFQLIDFVKRDGSQGDLIILAFGILIYPFVLINSIY